MLLYQIVNLSLTNETKLVMMSHVVGVAVSLHVDDSVVILTIIPCRFQQMQLNFLTYLLAQYICSLNTNLNCKISFLIEIMVEENIRYILEHIYDPCG